MQAVYSDPMVQLLEGDALEVLAELAPESVDLVVTSPPYYGLRKYPDTERVWGEGTTAWRGSFGNEPLADCGAWMQGVLTGQPIELCNVCYLCHSLLVLRAIRRVMKPWATCWWVVDDSMAGSGQGWQKDGSNIPLGWLETYGKQKPEGYISTHQGTIKAQDRMGIPERLSLALQADGWHWRSTIIWAKAREIEQDGEWTGEGSTMPESLGGWRWERHRVGEGRHDFTGGVTAWKVDREKDRAQYTDCPGCPKCAPNGGYVLRKGNWRPTDSYERIILLAKRLPYFGNSEAAATPALSLGRGAPGGSRWQWEEGGIGHGPESGSTLASMAVPNPAGRNPRSVWEINPEAYAGSHFSTFPSAIPRKIILAMSSARGNCSRCGQPWSPVVERTRSNAKVTPKTIAAHHARGGIGIPTGTVGGAGSSRVDPNMQVIGWLPSCSCRQEDGEPYAVTPAVILDPFAGTGTTLLEAKKLGRLSIGIELSNQYCKLATKRIQSIPLPLSLI